MGLRADLMGRLRLLVQAEGWTQAQAAEHFGFAQSRVCDLVRGNWDKLSLDMLITLTARAGHWVGTGDGLTAEFRKKLTGMSKLNPAPSPAGQGREVNANPFEAERSQGR